jgi:GT2 family glycosyltransferase
VTPKVTVLLAVHNGEPYVSECVSSVLGQTLGDFEFVIVDDASTDGTVGVVESFGDERIRLLRNERNVGQVPSLNRGLREAHGEYVARIDHDDWCRPTRLERQVAVLDAEPGVALVGTWMDVVEEGGRPITQLRSTIADFVEFLFQTLTMQVLISHPAAMYRRAPVRELGGYDESTAPAEDKDLWRRLALERWDARLVPEPLVVYRLHDAQLSQIHAQYQLEVDERSQERFLAALSPTAPVRTLRLLLAGDLGFWSECADAGKSRAALQALERLLADTRVRLRLSEAEASRLERLVSARLLHVARRGWRASATSFWRASPPLASRGLHAARSSKAPEAVAYAAAYAAAPLLRSGWRAKRRLTRGVARSRPLHGLRGPAKRSRLARRLYSKLIGSP